MPPRRSCFLLEAVLVPPAAPGFQCHHGVPASGEAPRREGDQQDSFQCHHGVPASHHLALGGGPPPSGFNATTAFLLLPRSVPPQGGKSKVSMPPRRSCFASSRRFRTRPSSRFNATTAFLLQLGGRLDAALICGFNATTAFLLLESGGEYVGNEKPFQCHHGVPASAKSDFEKAILGKFQCHHGVPASWRGLPMGFETEEFQCHHGVPASAAQRAPPCRPKTFQCHHGVPASSSTDGLTGEFSTFQCHHGVPASCPFFADCDYIAAVSMPPRRSCFPESKAG